MTHETLIRMLASLTTEELESLSGTVYSILEQRMIDRAPNYPSPTQAEIENPSMMLAIKEYRERTDSSLIPLRQIIGIFRYAKLKDGAEKALNQSRAINPNECKF